MTDYATQDRIGKIGGSDLPSILGRGYNSPYKAWRKIMGMDQGETNEHMLRGKRLEAGILELTADKYRHPVVGGMRLNHPDYPWLIGSLDGLLCLPDAVVPVEAKSVARFDGAPIDAHAIQLSHYTGMLLRVSRDDPSLGLSPQVYPGRVPTPTSYGILSVLCGPLNTFEIAHDPDEWESWIAKAKEFYERHIVTSVPPPLTTTEDVAIAHPTSTEGKKHRLGEDGVARLLELATLKRYMKEAKDRAKVLEVGLKAEMGSAEELLGDGNAVVATFRSHLRDRVDIKRLAKDHQVLVGKYRISSPVRQFRIKLAGTDDDTEPNEEE